MMGIMCLFLGLRSYKYYSGPTLECRSGLFEGRLLGQSSSTHLRNPMCCCMLLCFNLPLKYMCWRLIRGAVILYPESIASGPLTTIHIEGPATSNRWFPFWRMIKAKYQLPSRDAETDTTSNNKLWGITAKQWCHEGWAYGCFAGTQLFNTFPNVPCILTNMYP